MEKVGDAVGDFFSNSNYLNFEKCNNSRKKCSDMLRFDMFFDYAKKM